MQKHIQTPPTSKRQTSNRAIAMIMYRCVGSVGPAVLAGDTPPITTSKSLLLKVIGVMHVLPREFSAHTCITYSLLGLAFSSTSFSSVVKYVRIELSVCRLATRDIGFLVRTSTANRSTGCKWVDVDSQTMRMSLLLLINWAWMLVGGIGIPAQSIPTQLYSICTSDSYISDRANWKWNWLNLPSLSAIVK